MTACLLVVELKTELVDLNSSWGRSIANVVWLAQSRGNMLAAAGDLHVGCHRGRPNDRARFAAYSATLRKKFPDDGDRRRCSGAEGGSMASASCPMCKVAP